MLRRIGAIGWPGWLLVLAACGGSGAETVVTADYQDLPADRVMYGATFLTTTSGVRQARTRADSMYMDEDSTVAQLYGVKLMMYDTLGRVRADLTSRRGTLNQRTQKMVARGNVILRLADGRRIETEELNYDPGTHRIWSEVFTRVRHADGGSTTFQTFTADDKFESIQGTDVKGRIPGLKL